MFPIADMHCDLLTSLMQYPKISLSDPSLRCSLPQLKEGHVMFQVLAVFTETEQNSSFKGKKQIEIYKGLLKRGDVLPFDFEGIENHRTRTMLSIENASSFCEEDESLEIALKGLEEDLMYFKRMFSLSLTWNEENRFGGGNLSEIGLKPDGKKLLEFLSGKKIAIDLSHTSDNLAYDILDYILVKKLKLKVVATHSNARSVCCQRRNLPDALIQEIISQKGLIGLNFFRPFVGLLHTDLCKHVEKLFELGGESVVSFGADFFKEDLEENKKYDRYGYFPECHNSSCYQNVLEMFRKDLHLPRDVLEKIAFKNVERFLKRGA